MHKNTSWEPGDGESETPTASILLVDDNPRNLTALGGLLSDLSLELVLARSGEEALRALLAQDFALVLLDVRMPGLDGFETAALIRGRDRSKHTPIIFLTAHTHDEAQIVKGYSLGAVDFISKPFVAEVLRSKVKVFVSLYHKTEEIRRQARLLRQAEAREHARKMAEEKDRWETERLRQEMEKEREVARELTRRAEELARTVVERERAEAALRQNHERLRMVAAISEQLVMSSRSRRAARQIIARVSDHLGLELGALYLTGAEDPQPDARDTIPLAAARGIDEAAGEALAPLSTLGGIGQACARDRRRVVLGTGEGHDDGLACPLCALGRVRACVAMPLVASEHFIGILLLGSRHREPLSREEVTLLQTVCDQLASRLERGRLINELRQRAHALAEADRRKDEFLAMLGHELRNPLASLMTAAQLISADCSPENLLTTCEAIERQVRHMTSLVDDLLDVSRITRGKITLRRRHIDLREALRETVETIKPLIASRHQRLDLTLPGAACYVDGDPVRLVEVFSNILNNAAKYTDRNGHIALAVSLPNDAVQVEVRDDGIGIDAATLPHIFELFTQSERTLDRSQGGLGIGLTLVKHIIDMHGGDVSIHSRGLGTGTLVRVRLPRLSDDALSLPEAADALPELPSRDAPLRLMVIEDNPDIRTLLTAMLEAYGYLVETAKEGDTGVERLLELAPSVALVDIGLPGLDGYGVARRVRSDPRGVHIRLIAMTGYGNDADRARAHDAGFDTHLTKPVDIDELHRTIAALMTPPADHSGPGDRHGNGPDDHA